MTGSKTIQKRSIWDAWLHSRFKHFLKAVGFKFFARVANMNSILVYPIPTCAKTALQIPPISYERMENWQESLLTLWDFHFCIKFQLLSFLDSHSTILSSFLTNTSSTTELFKTLLLSVCLHLSRLPVVIMSIQVLLKWCVPKWIYTNANKYKREFGW